MIYLGGIDEDAYHAESVAGALDHIGSLKAVGDIHMKRNCLTAKALYLLGSIFSAFNIEIADCDRCTASSERQRDQSCPRPPPPPVTNAFWSCRSTLKLDTVDELNSRVGVNSD